MTQRGYPVQIVENWAELLGELESVEGSSPDMLDLRVRVMEVAPVEGFPNLMGDTAGKTIPITLMLDGGASALRPGDRIRFQVRKAAPERFFVRPGTMSQQ